MATVDVIIPVLKRPYLVAEAADSVLKQKGVHVNLFVVEDGPLDPQTSSLLPRQKNVKYIALKKNQGPAGARNAGVGMGKAPWVAFLDSDDLWLAEKLKKQIDFLSARPQVQWVHTNESWFRNSQPVKQKSVHQKQGGFFLERLFERCLISPSSVLFRRDFFVRSGGFAPAFRVAEDYELWLRLNFEAEVGFLEEPLTIKRAGNWPQLSATREIDRYRVLALHRFYRLYRRDPRFLNFRESFFETALKKISFLIKGASKYGHEAKCRQYQSWESCFLALRTKAMRAGSEGTLKN